LHINGDVPHLAGGVVAAGKHPPAAYHTASDTSANKHAEQVVTPLTGAVQPFAPGCRPYVVGNYHGESYGSLQISLEGDITPIEIGCERNPPGFLFHLPGNANPHTGRREISHFPEGPHIADNIFDDCRGPPFDIGCLPQPLTDTSLSVDMGNFQLGPSQVNTYRPSSLHVTLPWNLRASIYVRS
jgi:hypothetical protein